MEIELQDRVVFKNTLCCTGYFSNPYEVKEKVNGMIRFLKKLGIGHSNRVISKVLKKKKGDRGNVLKMEVMISCSNKISGESLSKSEFIFRELFVIDPSIKVSIPNNPKSFQQAVQTMLSYAKKNNLETIEPIIEVFKIDRYGNVIGFDLYLQCRAQEVITYVETQ
ncbi:hypothetical protein [Caldibacillus debilis]|uniref:hypothetical protein n=1 Tax=Caldibacillus debilis TaxID=301148 RepID=UPI000E37A692|nr:hypothetical protein [Caldibacillus debilis]REJ25588.1 MAG: hypothetical protein C6W56_13350 [Caldibacillus debilis]